MAKEDVVIKPFPAYAPTLGIIGNIPSTMLDPRAFTNCNNIRLKDGVASKRTGYVAYGTGTITGIPLLLFGYQQFNLTEYEILVTTTDVYYRNGGGAWAPLVGSLTGTVTNRASLAFIENYMVFTNGMDVPAKCLGTVWSALDSRTEFLLGTGWTSTGWTGSWAAGWVHTIGNVTALLQSKAAVSATVYQISYTVSGRTAGTFVIAFGGKTSAALSATGSWRPTTSSTASLAITPSTDFDGTIIIAIKVGTTVGWEDYRPKIFVPYKERLLGFNDNVSGSETAIREIHSVLGDFDNVNDTGAGFNDFTRGMGNEIVGAAELKDYVAVYKNMSCCLLDYIGGSSLYSLNAHVQGIGLGAPHCIANLGTSHIILGSDWNIHEWNGGWELNHIGDPIKKLLQSELTAASKAKAKMNFCVVNQEQREVTFFIVIGANEYPTRMWTYNLDDRSWVKGTIALISGGGSVTKAGVERSLLGLSAGTTHHYDYSALNDGAGAIDCNFETGDFVLSKEGYQERQRRYQGMNIDVKGYSTSSKLSLQHSVDEGTTWLPVTADEKTLTAAYAWTNWNFLKTARKIRFKFSDATKDESFYLRYYALNQKEGEIG